MDIKNKRVPENVECVGAYAETIAHICALMSFWFAFYYIFFLTSFKLRIQKMSSVRLSGSPNIVI
jgi:hypothetical protein